MEPTGKLSFLHRGDRGSMQHLYLRSTLLPPCRVARSKGNRKKKMLTKNKMFRI
jgi:hypothetical protein